MRRLRILAKENGPESQVGGITEIICKRHARPNEAGHHDSVY